eukprot:1160529-Pelagomonas_calceolata.AAC.10
MQGTSCSFTAHQVWSMHTNECTHECRVHHAASQRIKCGGCTQTSARMSAGCTMQPHSASNVEHAHKRVHT